MLTRWQWWLVGIAAFALALWGGAWYERRQGQQDEKVTILVHEVKVLDSIFVHDTLKASVAKAHYDTARVRDTLWYHDTLWVPRKTADSAVNSCTQALHDCGRLRIVNDSLTKLSGKKPGFFSRCGVGPGGGLIVTHDGVVHGGAGIFGDCHVWPR